MSEETTHVRNHFNKYRNAYLLGGGIVIGVLIHRAVSPKVVSIAPVFNNHNVNTNTVLKGYATKLVKCLETGQIWETLSDAAKAAGVSASTMSQHVNGHKDHISNMHYAIIGLGTGV